MVASPMLERLEDPTASLREAEESEHEIPILAPRNSREWAGDPRHRGGGSCIVRFCPAEGCPMSGGTEEAMSERMARGGRCHVREATRLGWVSTSHNASEVLIIHSCVGLKSCPSGHLMICWFSSSGWGMDISAESPLVTM
jgi:hypothetical protein